MYLKLSITCCSYKNSSLEITKGLSEVVIRTDNTIGKRKVTKGQTMIDKILHRKLKIEKHESHYKPMVNLCAPEG